MTVAAVDPDVELKQQTGPRTLVFILTWIAYASLYFGRKSFPVVKSTLENTLGISRSMLGNIDTGYLAAYAVGQFVNGYLGDRIGPRRLIGVGMLGVAAACTFFGLSSVAAIFFIAYIANGFFQSAGWPACVKAMGSWFTAKERGTVMGMWSTCYQLGGLAATAFATFLFARYGWRSAFIGPAVLIAIVGIVNFFLLPERTIERKSAKDIDASADTSLYREPVLWSLAAAYFCLKLIRYSILFWLPYYLNKVLLYSPAQAGYQSVSFEVGGVVGAIAVGFISDRYFPGRRRVISAIMTAMLAGALLLYIQLAPLSVALNFIGMALVGFCLFGPDTIICGAAAQDLGGKHNVAKAAGFINGVGSIGAVFQGSVTAGVSTSRFGWNGLFYLFVALALLSSVALLLGKRTSQQVA